MPWTPIEAALNDIQALGKERLKVAGAAEVAALAADAPLPDAAQAIFRKNGLDISSRSEWTDRLVQAIEGKNAEYLRRILAGVGSDSNKSSAEVFERATGVKLGNTQRERAQQIDEWAGITAERRAEIEAEKDASWQARERARKVQDARRMLTVMQVRDKDTGALSDGQQYLLGKVAGGFDEVGSTKRGAAACTGWPRATTSSS